MDIGTTSGHAVGWFHREGLSTSPTGPLSFATHLSVPVPKAKGNAYTRAMTDTHDPAGPGPDATERRLDELAERFHRTTAQAAEDYGVALYALEVLASPDKHSAGEQESALRHARRLIDEHSARNAASKEWLELRRRREADGPRADAPVEVIAERYDHPTHPHTHSSDYDADTCDLCFPEDAGPRDPKQAQL